MRIIEERLKWGQRFDHIYQLFVDVVVVGLFVQFEGGVAREGKEEEVRNYQITDDEPQRKSSHLCASFVRQVGPMFVVTSGSGLSLAFSECEPCLFTFCKCIIVNRQSMNHDSYSDSDSEHNL